MASISVGGTAWNAQQGATCCEQGTGSVGVASWLGAQGRPDSLVEVWGCMPAE